MLLREPCAEPRAAKARARGPLAARWRVPPLRGLLRASRDPIEPPHLALAAPAAHVPVVAGARERLRAGRHRATRAPLLLRVHSLRPRDAHVRQLCVASGDVSGLPTCASGAARAGPSPCLGLSSGSAQRRADAARPAPPAAAEGPA